MLLQTDSKALVNSVARPPMRAGLRGLASWGKFSRTTATMASIWRRDRVLRLASAALLLAAVAFLALDAAHDVADRSGWRSETLSDHRLAYLFAGSYAKAFSYCEAGGAVILAAAACARMREPIYLGAIFVFFVMLLDTTLGIHRHLARGLVKLLDLSARPGIASIELLGEAAMMAAIALGLLAALVIGAAKSRSGHAQVGLVLIALLLLLGFFAGGFALLSTMIAVPGDRLFLPLKISEEIGQMLALGAACVIMAIPAIHGDRLVFLDREI